MKNVAIIFVLALAGVGQAQACDYLTGGCILQQYAEVDIQTILDKPSVNAGSSWIRGFLWND